MRILFLLLMFLIGSFDSSAQSKRRIKKDTLHARALLTSIDTLLPTRKFDIALERAAAAKKTFTKYTGATSLAVADCWYAEAQTNLHREKAGDAAKCLHQTIEIWEQVYQKPHPKIEKALVELGVTYRRIGNFQRALNYLQQAQEIRTVLQLPDDRRAISIYTNMGIAYKRQGMLNKSIRYYRRALEILVAEEKSDNKSIGSVYKNIANAYKNLKKYEQAREYYDLSMNTYLMEVDSMHVNMAGVYNDMGNFFKNTEEYERSIANHQKAIQIREEKRGKRHYNTAVSYENIGSAYIAKGDYESAILYLNKALSIIIERFGDRDMEVAYVKNELANMEISRQNYTAALVELDTALMVHQFENPKDIPNIPALIDLNATCFLAGKAYQMRYLESGETADLYAADRWLQNSITVMDYQADKSAGNDKIQLTDAGFSTYATAIHNKNLLWELTDSIKYLQSAFALSERVKSNYLYQTIQEAEALSFAGIPDSILESESDLRAEITFHEKRRHRFILRGKSPTDSVVLKVSGQIFDLNQQYEALKENLEKNYADYYNLKYDLNTVDIPQLQQELLGTDETLLEYFIGDSTICIFVVNTDTFLVKEIANNFPLTEWIRTFRTANNNEQFQMRTREYSETAYQLYEKLIAPVANHLKEKIIVVPDGVLGYVPFESLLMKPVTKPNRFKNYEYLLRKHQVSYCYSATLLKEMLQKKHRVQPEKDLLAFAPFYVTDTTLLSAIDRRFEALDSTANLTLLPLSGEEIMGVQRVTGGDIYYDEQATEATFTSLASNYRLLHLATHGKANDQEGDFSYLAFAKKADSLQHELLYVRDLYNLQLNADMVVLSACETGVGELQRGEGIISMARGFTYAGAKSIITSLWSVGDEPTKDLMIAFYENLQNGMTKDAALRQAKLDFIDSENRKHAAVHPFYWSGFIGIGDMGAL